MPGGFPQLLRVWETSIAPFERLGTAWRSEKAPPDGVGTKEAQRVKDLITRWYLPALYAMMKLVEEGATRQDAAAKLQRDKGAQDISKSIKALPKPDEEAKARYRTMLFEVSARSPDRESSRVSFDLDSPSWAELKAELKFKEVSPLQLAPATAATAAAATSSRAASVSVVSSSVAAATFSTTTTRYLALDPAMSCGWAVVHVQDAQIVDVDVGVIAVHGGGMGERGASLQQQLQPLLASPPAHAFVEKFCGTAPRGDDVNHGLRTAIEMLLYQHRIPYTMVAQQTWKASLGAGKGMRGKSKQEQKAAVAAAVEAKLGSSFPATLPIGGKTLSFRDDASDAAAIALCGVKEMLGEALSWIQPVPISAPPLTSGPIIGTDGGNGGGGGAGDDEGVGQANKKRANEPQDDAPSQRTRAKHA